MAYDPTQHSIVLFGGTYFGAEFITYADTWLFDGENWQLTVPLNSPPPTWNAGFAFDASANGILMFGGNSPNQNDLTNELWQYMLVP